MSTNLVDDGDSDAVFGTVVRAHSHTLGLTLAIVPSVTSPPLHFSRIHKFHPPPFCDPLIFVVTCRHLLHPHGLIACVEAGSVTPHLEDRRKFYFMVSC